MARNDLESSHSDSLIPADIPLGGSMPHRGMPVKKRSLISVGKIRREQLFKQSLVLMALLLLVIILAIFFTLVVESMPSIKAFGLHFLASDSWNPVTNRFGALPFLVGTLLTSFLALLISLPFSFSIAIFLGEYHPKGSISSFLKSVVELIAGIPSVIYGFWGLFVIVPVMRNLELKFGIAPYGIGIFTASVILAIMIIPYAASMGREIIRMVPNNLKEAAYSLGATRYEVVRNIILPYTKSGLFAGILLSLGRALGETMAVTMVIGNTNDLPHSIFAPGNTMASVIANEFTEAASTLYLSSLIEMGLALFLVTTLINIIGKSIVNRFGTV